MLSNKKDFVLCEALWNKHNNNYWTDQVYPEKSKDSTKSNWPAKSPQPFSRLRANVKYVSLLGIVGTAILVGRLLQLWNVNPMVVC